MLPTILKWVHEKEAAFLQRYWGITPATQGNQPGVMLALTQRTLGVHDGTVRIFISEEQINNISPEDMDKLLREEIAAAMKNFKNV